MLGEGRGLVVIVGAGIAGLACAVACVRAGLRVRVLEAHLRRTVPAHLDVVPNLLRDLARLGVADECLRRGFAYNGLAVMDEGRASGFEVPTPRLAGDRLPPALGMAYDDLIDVLEGAAVAAGAELHRGQRVTHLDAEAGRLRLAGGEEVIADLVVLATGAESPLVTACFGPVARPRPAQTWWHALVPRPQELDRATWLVGSQGRRLHLVPVGMSTAGIALVATEDAPAEARGAALVRSLRAGGEWSRRLARLLGPHPTTALRLDRGALMAAPWHRGVALCVGASAHALAPQFGQSAAQALEDALVLGELCGQGLAVPALLAQFMARRHERVCRVHCLTEQAARWYAQPDPTTDLPALARELGALVAAPA